MAIYCRRTAGELPANCRLEAGVPTPPRKAALPPGGATYRAALPSNGATIGRRRLEGRKK